MISEDNQPGYIGHVDTHRGGFVRGWACNAANPEESVVVRVLLREEQIGSVVADQFRRDLADAGVGNGSGCYMFRYAIPDPVRRLGRYELRFVTPGDSELAGSPFPVVETDISAFRLKAPENAALSRAEVRILPSPSLHSHSLSVNSGLVFLNASRGEPGPRTVIVTGHARSGTSLVARALHIAGLPMGLPVPILSNYEDKQFVKVLQEALDHPPLNTRTLDELIRSRNESHRDWGFKAPAAMASISHLIHRCRNPHIVLVFRDALATGIRERLAVDEDLWESFESILAYETLMLRFMRNTDVPCFLVSYEKALLDKKHFCRSLAEFVGMECDDSWISQAIGQINPNQEDYLEGVREARKDLGLPSLQD